MIATSAGQTPRNRKQAYNMKQHKHVGPMSLEHRSSDVLGSLLSMANDEKQGDPNNVFIRSIQTHPNPLLLVLATATQFQNLETYCTSQYVSSVMTIDPTFNIGKFSVTPVTYQYLLLISMGSQSLHHYFCWCLFFSCLFYISISFPIVGADL